jgi:regulator of protease activity HflC (stomatin/prohibitin superfamily)
MFGYRYVKASPSTYVIQYKNGKPVREGAGLTFWYFAPSTTLVSITLESVDAPFMFQEVSSDFQVVTVQGQVAYRVAAPTTLAGLMNFTSKPDGGYASEDPTKLPQRVVNVVQVQLRSVLQGQTLQELLRGSDHLVQVVREGLQGSDGLPGLGLELINLSILAVKPNPETARALEAQVREQILKQADDATYIRRNAAIEQEREGE